MEVENFIPYYPSIDDVNFNTSFSSKQEFKELSLDVTEDFPSKKGDKLKHQTLVARMLSSYTPIDNILLLHDMGTGKTCTVISVIEKLRNENNGITNFVYVAKNDNLLDKFKDEYLNTCTEKDYTEVKWPRLNISLLTIEKFAKTYDNELTFSQLDNSLIIIDEIHNIRDIGNKIYDIYHSVLHERVNSKIILLSGTPMMDTANEISSVMNLILPLDQQLPSGSVFDSMFIDGNVLTQEQDKINMLRQAFKGRVSYLKSMSTSVRRKFIGQKIQNFKHFLLKPSLMSEYQTAKYVDVLNIDEGNTDDPSSPAYSNTLQCSDFVSPKGFYGVKATDSIPFISSSSVSDKLLLLKKYSAKYHDSVKNILDSKNDKKSMFIYNSHVEGGGLEGFARILNNFNFTRVGKNNIPVKKGNRYIILTSKDSKDHEVLRQAFNKEENMNGEYIKIILASAAISEGFTFKNIQVVDIHSPWFNFSKISQVIARSIRVGSHNDLIKKQGNIDVDIILRVSIPIQSGLRSVEIDVYKMAEDKDILSKQIEHIIKEEAIDSKITSDRNKRDSMFNYSRECEYMDCVYTSFPNESKQIEYVDYSTYNIYYPNLEYYINDIISVFGSHVSRTFDQIQQAMSIDKNILLVSLDHIIENNIIIKNESNDFYMRHQNNIYYLVNHLYNTTTLLDIFYTSNKLDESKVSIKPVKNTEMIKMNVLNSVTPYTSKSIKLFNFNTRQLDMYELQSLLEDYLYKKTNTPGYYITEIDERFKGTYGIIDETNTMYVWYLTIEFNSTSRVLNQGVWRDCTQDENIKVLEYLKRQRLLVTNKARLIFGDQNPYYGIFKYNRNYYLESDVQPKDFLLFKVEDIDSVKNESEKSKGMRCTSYTGAVQKQILEVIIKRLKKVADETDIDYSTISDKQLKGKCKLSEFLMDKLGITVIDFRS